MKAIRLLLCASATFSLLSCTEPENWDGVEYYRDVVTFHADCAGYPPGVQRIYVRIVTPEGVEEDRFALLCEE